MKKVSDVFFDINKCFILLINICNVHLCCTFCWGSSIRTVYFWLRKVWSRFVVSVFWIGSFRICPMHGYRAWQLKLTTTIKKEKISKSSLDLPNIFYQMLKQYLLYIQNMIFLYQPLLVGMMTLMKKWLIKIVFLGSSSCFYFCSIHIRASQKLTTSYGIKVSKNVACVSIRRV